MDRNFIVRLISGIVLLAALVFFFVMGNPYLVCLAGVLSLVATYELMRVFGLEKSLISIVCYLSVVAYYILLILKLSQWVLLVFAITVLIQLSIYVFTYPKHRISEVTKSIFAFFYTGVMLSYIPMTRDLPEGAWLVWLIIIGSWGADTCAYVVGKLIGKHHFSELSPKKTIEGCVGGVVGAALIFSFFFPYEIEYSLSAQVAFPIVAVVSALVSMVGDLSASAIKRNYDIKDYGNIIPGHGGVMDRFDSVIFVAPFVYYLLVFIQG